MWCINHHEDNSFRQFPNKIFLLIITCCCRNDEGLSFHCRSTHLIWHLLPHSLMGVHERGIHHQLIDQHLHFGDFVAILRDWICPTWRRALCQNLALAGGNQIVRSTPPGQAYLEGKMSRCGRPTNEASADCANQFARAIKPKFVPPCASDVYPSPSLLQCLTEILR